MPDWEHPISSGGATTSVSNPDRRRVARIRSDSTFGGDLSLGLAAAGGAAAAAVRRRFAAALGVGRGRGRARRQGPRAGERERQRKRKRDGDEATRGDAAGGGAPSALHDLRPARGGPSPRASIAPPRDRRRLQSPPPTMTAAVPRSPRLRRAPLTRLPRPLHHLRADDDGRQHRARDQLLGGLPEVPFARAGRLRGAVALAPLPAVLGAGGRAQRSLRHPADHPGRHAPVRHRLGRVGIFLRHRFAAPGRRHGAAGAPRLRRRAVADVQPDVAARHRRAGVVAERRSAQRHRALPGRAGRSGGGRAHHAHAGPDPRHLPQHGLLSAADLLVVAGALRAALPGRFSGAGARGAVGMADIVQTILRRAGDTGAGGDDPAGPAVRRSSSATAIRRRCRGSRTIWGTAIWGPRTACCWRPRSRRARWWRGFCSRAAAWGTRLDQSPAPRCGWPCCGRRRWSGPPASRIHPLALVLLFTAGFFELVVQQHDVQTLVQVHAPAAIRVRVIGLFNMSSLGLRAFSGITVGLVGSLDRDSTSRWPSRRSPSPP